MKITEVKATKVQDQGNVRAYASITIDNDFVVSGLKVVEGSKGLFVAMPSRKNKKDEFKDIAFPINKEAREYLVSEVLKAYEAAE